MNKEQSKINNEQIQIRILSRIKRYPDNNWRLIDYCIFEGMTKAELRPVFYDMMDENLIVKVKRRYLITDDGLEVLAVAESDPRLPINTRIWKEEALTGITTRSFGNATISERSDITNAVIPKGC